VCHLVPYFSGKSAGFFRLRQLLCRFFSFRDRKIHPRSFSPQFAPLAAAAGHFGVRRLAAAFSVVKFRTPAKHPQPQLTARKAAPLRQLCKTPKPFRCNTYKLWRMCCNQRTYASSKSFRCNTYKKHGGVPRSPSASPRMKNPTISEGAPPAFEWDPKSAVRFPQGLSVARVHRLFAG